MTTLNVIHLATWVDMLSGEGSMALQLSVVYALVSCALYISTPYLVCCLHQSTYFELD